jgi:hypothetical protein
VRPLCLALNAADVATEQLAVDLPSAGVRYEWPADPFLRSLAHMFDQKERKTSTTPDTVFITNRAFERRWRQPQLFLPRGVLGKDLAFLPSNGMQLQHWVLQSPVIRRRHDLLVAAGVSTVSGRVRSGAYNKKRAGEPARLRTVQEPRGTSCGFRRVADDGGVAPGR